MTVPIRGRFAPRISVETSAWTTNALTVIMVSVGTRNQMMTVPIWIIHASTGCVSTNASRQDVHRIIHVNREDAFQRNDLYHFDA